METFFDLILYQPLGWLMRSLYNLFGGYALAILFFALIVKMILIPFAVKQQKNQIKMAKLRPKEMAIRGKYAGRNDAATTQKMNTEIMAMQKAENYSAFSGCLPMLLQLPILFALFAIIRGPLTYISNFDKAEIAAIRNYLIAPDAIVENVGSTTDLKNKFGYKPDVKPDNNSIPELAIVKIFDDEKLFLDIKENVVMPVTDENTGETKDVQVLAEFKPLNFAIFNEQLTTKPQDAKGRGFLSILILIPILNFGTNFVQMRLTKKINANTMPANMANNGSMKIMEWTMPLLVVYMAYTMESALGLYWICQAVFGIAQTIILAKIYPLPVITEEDYELARQQYGAAVKKKKKKKPVEEEETDESDDSDDDNDDDDNSGSFNNTLPPSISGGGAPVLKDNGDGKYISKTVPKGINQNAKNNYQKTGKKYKINRRKK